MKNATTVDITVQLDRRGQAEEGRAPKQPGSPAARERARSPLDPRYAVRPTYVHFNNNNNNVRPSANRVAVNADRRYARCAISFFRWWQLGRVRQLKQPLTETNHYNPTSATCSHGNFQQEWWCDFFSNFCAGGCVWRQSCPAQGLNAWSYKKFWETREKLGSFCFLNVRRFLEVMYNFFIKHIFKVITNILWKLIITIWISSWNVNSHFSYSQNCNFNVTIICIKNNIKYQAWSSFCTDFVLQKRKAGFFCKKKAKFFCAF